MDTGTSPFALVPFETVGIGTASGCIRPANLVITTAAEWQRVWAVHAAGRTPAPALPAVDFSRQVVLALLAGNTTAAGATAEVAQIVRGPSEMLVYYSVNRDGGSKLAGGAAATQPYHFAVIDRPSTPLRFVDAFHSVCTTCHP